MILLESWYTYQGRVIMCSVMHSQPGITLRWSRVQYPAARALPGVMTKVSLYRGTSHLHSEKLQIVIYKM
jgi:hypothetical protein